MLVKQYTILNCTAEQAALPLGEKVTLKQWKDKSFPVSFPNKAESYSLKYITWGTQDRIHVFNSVWEPSLCQYSKLKLSETGKERK